MGVQEPSSSKMLFLCIVLLSVFVRQCYSVDCTGRTYTSRSGYLVHDKRYGSCSKKNYDIVLNDPSIVIELDWKDFYMEGSMPSCLKEKVRIFTG